LRRDAQGIKKKFSKSLEDSKILSTFAVPNGGRRREGGGLIK